MAFHPPELFTGELTRLVEQRRADYHRMKAADKEVSREELSEARAAYEQALVRLSRLFQRARGQRLRRAS
jgi:hypothetical protein